MLLLLLLLLVRLLLLLQLLVRLVLWLAVLLLLQQCCCWFCLRADGFPPQPQRRLYGYVGCVASIKGCRLLPCFIHRNVP